MTPDVALFIEQLINGLALAGIYLLVALGLTLLFGLTRIVFFAQGELVTLGAFVCFTLVQLGVPVLPALLGSAIAVGLAAEVLDLTILRPTLARPMNGFVISLALILVLEAAYSLHWSSDFYSIPPLFRGTLRIGAIVLNEERLAVVSVTALLTAVAFLMLDRTHFGRGVRALAEDRMSARALGVPVGRLISVVFIAGCALAALAGGLLGTIFPFTALFGPTFLLKGFAVAIVGGLGNVRGAVVAAVILALSETLGAAYISLAWSYAFLLLTMIAIILIRPYGLFKSRQQAGGVDPLAGAHLSSQAPGVMPSFGTKWFARIAVAGPHIGFVALLVAVALFPYITGTYRDTALGTFALVNAIGVYSLWFAFRFAGIFSIAQASFVGIGAYATTIAAIHWGVSFWAQIALAVGGGILGGFLFGLISLRATGSYFVILLFALSDLELTVIQNLPSSVAGGLNGLVLPVAPDPLFGAVDFSNPVALYYLVFVATCIAITFLWWLTGSRFGRLLITVRDNQTLANALGLNTFRYKLAALAVSGGVAGLSGALYVYAAVGIDPSYFNANASIQMVLMMIVGGSGSLAGPAIGAFIAAFLPDVLHVSPYVAQMIYGLLLIVVIVLLPSGIAGTVRSQYVRVAKRLLRGLQVQLEPSPVHESPT